MKNLIYILLFVVLAASVEAGYTIVGNKVVNDQIVATLSCEEHYNIAMKAYQEGDWDVAGTQFNLVRLNYPSTPEGSRSTFFYGVCLYEQQEYDFANEAFNVYLKGTGQPEYFKEAMDYKFAIANAFYDGAKRHCFGSKKFPKIMAARNLAVVIYDEIIETMPCHEYAVQALWAKGNICLEEKLYRESIDAFQTLIRRFPRHELTPESYLAINRVYLTEAEWEFQNPDLLQLAELNFRRFEQEFPRDERVSEAEADIGNLREIYAAGLLKTGKYYEGQGAPKAAIIYYMNALSKFPETRVAESCRARLDCLQHAAH